METLPFTAQDADAKSSSAVTTAVRSEAPPSSTLTPPALPSRHASVLQVREYIKGLLVSKHMTSEEYADEMAAKWTLGRGWDLRELSEERFKRLFGSEIGSHLHRDVKEDWAVEIKPEEDRKLAEWKERGGPREFRNVIGASLIAAAIILIVRGKLNYALFMIAITQFCFARFLPTKKSIEGLLMCALILTVGAIFATNMDI